MSSLPISNHIPTLSLPPLDILTIREVMEKEYQELCTEFPQLNPHHHPDLFSVGLKTCDSEILPNEPTRFKFSDPDTYYNANLLLNGLAIAAQGPTSDTKDQFWKMVWESGSNTIVMLTDLSESGTYWPKEGETWRIGNFDLQCKSENNELWARCPVINRIFQLKNETSERIVYHFQIYKPAYLETMPDFPLVRIIENNIEPRSKGTTNPPIIHCTSGVGLTGALLLAYAVYKSLLEGKDDPQLIRTIAGELRSPEKGRNGMIQTADQFFLAHKLIKKLKEWIHFNKSKNSPKKPATHAEYREICDLFPKLRTNAHPDLFGTALKAVGKNRYGNILPNEPTRFIFSDPTQYCNANWLLNKTVIATQGPHKNTMRDFWTMVWESGSDTIVMLTDPIEDDEEKCAVYWPQNRDEVLPLSDQSTVKMIHETSDTVDGYEIKTRRFLFKIGDGEREVLQYHLCKWGDHGVASPKALAYLTTLVEKRTTPPIVHCSAGVGRSGTFIAAYSAYKNLLGDKRHPHKIRKIVEEMRDPQKGRSGMIQTAEQYDLVHQAFNELRSNHIADSPPNY